VDYEIKVNDKISLKLRKEENAQTFFEIVDCNREEFRKWFPWVDVTLSLEDSKKFIIDCQEGFQRKKSADFGIVYEGEFIWSMGLHTIKLEHGFAEIGYLIAKDFQGKGIMTECVKAMINYGFNELQLHRIQIRCDLINIKSKAILERLGFKLEGVLRQNRKHEDDTFSDELIYGLLRNEWNIL
jgi:ribosomal-protein-serine acetyltransferase